MHQLPTAAGIRHCFSGVQWSLESGQDKRLLAYGVADSPAVKHPIDIDRRRRKCTHVQQHRAICYSSTGKLLTHRSHRWPKPLERSPHPTQTPHHAHGPTQDSVASQRTSRRQEGKLCKRLHTWIASLESPPPGGSARDETPEATATGRSSVPTRQIFQLKLSHGFTVSDPPVRQSEARRCSRDGGSDGVLGQTFVPPATDGDGVLPHRHLPSPSMPVASKLRIPNSEVRSE